MPTIEKAHINPLGFREYDARWLYPKDINAEGIKKIGQGLGSQIILKTKITNISKIISWNADTNSLDVIVNKDVLIDSNKISQISDNISSYDQVIDAKQSIITPGFIDTHTHPIFIGNRSNEFKMRAQGKTYQEISQMGGGINSSVNSLRQASDEELYNASLENIKPFIDFL